jgi:hypothetical protein
VKLKKGKQKSRRSYRRRFLFLFTLATHQIVWNQGGFFAAFFHETRVKKKTSLGA